MQQAVAGIAVIGAGRLVGIDDGAVAGVDQQLNHLVIAEHPVVQRVVFLQLFEGVPLIVDVLGSQDHAAQVAPLAEQRFAPLFNPTELVVVATQAVAAAEGGWVVQRLA